MKHQSSRRFISSSSPGPGRRSGVAAGHLHHNQVSWGAAAGLRGLSREMCWHLAICSNVTTAVSSEPSCHGAGCRVVSAGASWYVKKEETEWSQPKYLHIIHSLIVGIYFQQKNDIVYDDVIVPACCVDKQTNTKCWCWTVPCSRHPELAFHTFRNARVLHGGWFYNTLFQLLTKPS